MGTLSPFPLHVCNWDLRGEKANPQLYLNTAEVVGGEALVLSLSVSPHKKGSWCMM